MRPQVAGARRVAGSLRNGHTASSPMPHFFGQTGPRDPAPDEPGAESFSVEGATWVAVRRHEMTRLARGVVPERRLLVHFFGPAGEHRVAVAPNDPVTADELRALWQEADR